MYLRSMHLHNFKCYEDISIDFHKNLTVIVGENGAGKTSVLEGIAIGLSTMFQPLENAKSHGIDSKTQVRLKPFNIGSGREMPPQYPVEIALDAVMDGENIHWKRSLNTAKSSTTTREAKQIIKAAAEYQNRIRSGDTSLLLPILAYYGTGRLWNYHREKQYDIFKTNSRLNGYIDSLDGPANVKLMMNWFLKMTVQKYQDQENGLEQPPELTAVLYAMETCYKQITGIADCKVQYSMGTNELILSYQNENGELVRLPVNQLSDGYKSTISLVADIAYRMAVLNPQLLDDICTKTQGVVLIDEVDLHLHPSWQQRVLNDLMTIFPCVQFIVTTHAPAVINTIRSENLVLLHSDHTVDYPAGEVYGKDVNTILRGTMHTNERPKEVKELFNEFYDHLSSRNYEAAQRTLEHITELIQSDDSDLAACKIKLELRQHRGGKT